MEFGKQAVEYYTVERKIVVKDFPLSISLNNMYATYKNRRVPSKELVNYKSQCHIYCAENIDSIEGARKILQEDEILQLDANFYFDPRRCWTKDGRPKQMDLSNFVKAFEDAIAGIFKFNDKQLWKINVAKIPSEFERIDFVLQPMNVD